MIKHEFQCNILKLSQLGAKSILKQLDEKKNSLKLKIFFLKAV